MNFWRMQLHPNKPSKAASYAVQSLAANFIGLDFKTDVGDLLMDENQNIVSTQKDYRSFAKDMQEEDKVLIIVHHFPFAVVTIDGDYNYIRDTVPEIGVWFKHFRRVKDVKYYSDYKTNAQKWEKITMTDAISILKTKTSKSYKLIKKMTK